MPLSFIIYLRKYLENFYSAGDHPETDEESELNARNRLHHHHHHHRHHHRASGTSKPASEDEFAEDELSLGEPSEARMLTSSSGPAWGTCPAGGRLPRERRGRSPRSLDRRRRDKNHDVGEFHEGMLLDTLLQQLYPSVAGIKTIKSVTIIIVLLKIFETIITV